MIRARVPRELLVAGAPGSLRLTGPEHHYLSRVRRVRVGEELELFDGEGGRARARVVALDGEGCELRVESLERVPHAGARLSALVPLLKGERMDVCVEKLVEVGCDRLVLWQAERSVVRLEGARRAARVERIAAQAEAASRQSGRAAVPEVVGVWSLVEALARSDEELKVVLDPAAPRLDPAASAPRSVALLSGPEGGLTPTELEQAVAAGFALASLTETVLRAETAPAIAVALWRWHERGARAP